MNKQEYQAKQAERRRLEAEMQAETSDYVEELVKEFLEKHPSVQDVHWQQWTPGFNDGEPCTFSVHDFYMTWVDEDREDEDGESKPYTQSDLDYQKSIVKAWEEYKADPAGYERAHQDYPAQVRQEYRAPARSTSYGYYDRGQEARDYVPHRVTEESAREQAALIEEELASDPTLGSDWKTLVGELEGVSDEDMSTAFGDPSKVVVTRDGLEIEETEPGY